MKQTFSRHLIGPLAGIGLCAGSVAMAADLPVAPPPPPPVFSWTGPYVGLLVGGAIAGTTSINNGLLTNGVPFNSSFNRDGVFGGLHLGYNYQVGSFVLGLQAEYSFAGVTGSGQVFPAGTLSPLYITSSLRQFGSVDGRIGVAYNRWLVYAIGGFAYADQRHSIVTGGFGLTRDYGSNEYGWDVGGGVEYALTDNWTARVEYRYYNWGNKGFTDVLLNNNLGVPVVSSHSTTETMHTIRAALTYKFSWPPVAPAPMVAKY
jgi:outer membrane immunogenic protein